MEIHVLHDRDIVLTELFQEEWLAMNWAQAYGERLKRQGWYDSADLPQQGNRRQPEQKRHD